MTKPDALTDRELHEAYDNFLDEAYPDLEIAGLSYSTSSALKEVDPTAYRCGFNDWLDGEMRNEVYAEGDDGETYDFNAWQEYQELKDVESEA